MCIGGNDRIGGVGVSMVIYNFLFFGPNSLYKYTITCDRIKLIIEIIFFYPRMERFVFLEQTTKVLR